MSIHVVCPSCNAGLEANESSAGRKKKCPRCGGIIAVPATEEAISFSQEDTVADPPPTWEPPTTVAVRPKKRAARADSFSIAQLFDWRFEYYLTPSIIRAYWVMALIAVALSLAYSGISALSQLGERAPSNESGPDEHFALRTPSSLLDPGSTSGERAAVAAIIFFLRALASLAGLLFVRMACELAIVIFNIAKAAANIERALSGPPDDPAGAD